MVVAAIALVLTVVAVVVWAGTDIAPSPTPIPVPAPERWSYVAAGDSLATGFGLIGYVEHYRSAVQVDTGRVVDLRNLAQDGWTAEQLVAALQHREDVRRAVSDAQVFTFNILGNDLRQARVLYKAGDCGGEDNQDCLREAVDRAGRLWDEVLAQVVVLADPRTKIVRTMNVYYPFVGEDARDGSLDVLLPYLREVNDEIGRASDEAGIPMADVFAAFNGPDGRTDPGAAGLLHTDGLHPSEEGHRLIAEALRELGYDPIL